MTIEEQPQRNLLVELLRWVVALPAAIVAAYASYFVTAWAVRFGMAFAGIRPDSLWVQLWDVTFVHGCIGAAFVYVGAFIVPRLKAGTAIVLVCLAIAGAGVMAFFAFDVSDWWALASAAALAVGAVIMLIAVRRGEVQLDF